MKNLNFADVDFYRTRKGLSKKEFSELTGLHATHYTRYLSGELRVKPERWITVANVLGVDVNELLCGSDDGTISANFVTMHSEVEGLSGEEMSEWKKVPLIGWATAQDYNNLTCPINDYARDNASDEYGFPKARRGDFCIKIVGDSMTPWYPHGTVVLVRPTEPPRNGKRVIAKLNSGEIVFKIFIENGDKIILQSLSNHNDCKNFEYSKNENFAYWIYPIKASIRDEDDIDTEISHTVIPQYHEEALQNKKESFSN